MGKLTVLALRIVLAMVLAGSLFVQAVMVPLLAIELEARRGTVFSHAAFRYVDVVIGAVAAASLLTFGLGVTLAPGDAVARA